MRTILSINLSLLAAGLVFVPLALPQKLTIGAVVGTSITGDYRSGSVTNVRPAGPDEVMGSTTFVSAPVSRSLIIGPKLQLKLPHGLSLELDALHRPLRSTITEFLSPPLVLPSGVVLAKFGPNTSTGATWEIPVMAKYRLPLFRWHPFLETGPSFRPAGSSAGLTHLGVSAGAGLELKVHSLMITPGVRYTRWRAQADRAPEAIANQVEFLVGVERGDSGSGWANAFGLRFSIGVLAGVGLGDDLRAAKSSESFLVLETPESNSPIAGVTVELELGRSLFLETDGLYRALHATDSSSDGRVRFAVLTWEFPVLAKYKFRQSHRARPFVELGPSFRVDGNFNGPTPSHYGVTGGAGVEARLARLKISPAIRYTRWARERSPQSPFQSSTFLNEVECLVGLSF